LFVDLGGLSELGEKFFQPGVQIDALLVCGVAARQLQHVVDDGADALAIAGDDGHQPPFALWKSRRLREQLCCVAHGTHRVADFVRDTGAQTAERRQFGLLHSLSNQRGVFEKDQRRPSIAAIERYEVRLHHAAAIGRHHCLGAHLPIMRMTSPSIEQVEQSRRDLSEQRSGSYQTTVEQLGR
jgi:hypothetical protein